MPTSSVALGEALEGLRAGKITVAQVRRLLGIASRYEMDGFLKSHDILLPLSVESLEQDAETAIRGSLLESGSEGPPEP